MLFRGKPEYNKKGKPEYKIDLVEFTLYEVFFYTNFHSNNLAESGINRTFEHILKSNDELMVRECINILVGARPPPEFV